MPRPDAGRAFFFSATLKLWANCDLSSEIGRLRWALPIIRAANREMEDTMCHYRGSSLSDERLTKLRLIARRSLRSSAPKPSIS